MYCPNCGSANQQEVKFCTRCGTNLGLVSEALTGKISGKTSGKTRPDDRIAKLMKDYYGGRRDSITGMVLLPAGLLIMAIMMAAGMKPIGAFFIICWMFFWGAASLAGGLGKWLASRAEMKSLGIGSHSHIQVDPRQLQFQGSSPDLLRPEYSTGPVEPPTSVTERTTHLLDETDKVPADNSR